MISEWKDLLVLANTALGIGVAVYAWITAKSKVNAERLNGVDERLAGHGGRLDRIETEMKHMPAKDDVHDLKLAIAELRGTVGQLDESHTGVSRAVRRIEEFLMRDKK